MLLQKQELNHTGASSSYTTISGMSVHLVDYQHACFARWRSGGYNNIQTLSLLKDLGQQQYQIMQITES